MKQWPVWPREKGKVPRPGLVLQISEQKGSRPEGPPEALSFPGRPYRGALSLGPTLLLEALECLGHMRLPLCIEPLLQVGDELLGPLVEGVREHPVK